MVMKHCLLPVKHRESGTVTTFSIFPYLFLVHGISWCFTALFHAVSLLFHAVSRCFTALIHSVSRCFIALFHGVSRCWIALFHPVSWPWTRCSGNEPLWWKKILIDYWSWEEGIFVTVFGGGNVDKGWDNKYWCGSTFLKSWPVEFRQEVGYNTHFMAIISTDESCCTMLGHLIVTLVQLVVRVP